jgi:hypothetical protein
MQSFSSSRHLYTVAADIEFKVIMLRGEQPSDSLVAHSIGFESNADDRVQCCKGLLATTVDGLVLG